MKHLHTEAGTAGIDTAKIGCIASPVGSNKSPSNMTTILKTVNYPSPNLPRVAEVCRGRHCGVSYSYAQ
jgi:hypothetical protein